VGRQLIVFFWVLRPIHCYVSRVIHGPRRCEVRYRRYVDLDDGKVDILVFWEEEW
jgi:hypothetical protein